jgi:hypothetical protein
MSSSGRMVSRELRTRCSLPLTRSSRRHPPQTSPSRAQSHGPAQLQQRGPTSCTCLNYTLELKAGWHSRVDNRAGHW